VVSGISTETIELPGLGHGSTVVIEPWLDERCGRFAVEKCPALIRRHSREDLKLVPIRGPEDVVLIMSKGWVEGPFEESTKAEPVGMWSKAVLRNVELRRSA
jgi:hypothetical protein